MRSQQRSSASPNELAQEQRDALAALAGAVPKAGATDKSWSGGTAREEEEWVEPGSSRHEEPQLSPYSEELVDTVDSLANASRVGEPPVRGLITSMMFALVVFLCGLLVRRYLPAARKHCLCLGGLACLALSPYVSILLHHAAAPSLPEGTLPPSRFRQAPRKPATFPIPAPSASSNAAAPVVNRNAAAAAVATMQPQAAPKTERIGGETSVATALPASHSVPQPDANADAVADCWPKADVTPLDFGGVGDGQADDTEAVRSCFAYVSRCRGTDAVLGPAGRRFLVRPGEVRVRLRDVRLRLEGEILGPSLRDWNPYYDVWPAGSCAYGETGCTPGQSKSPEFVRSQWSLLHIVESNNVTILGPGGLRAPGRSFWAVRNTRPEVRGYCLLKLERSSGVRVRGLALTDSPMYQLVVMHCVDVDLRGLSIVVNDETVGEGGPHNTDGVSIIASQGVRVRDSEVESGDDNVVIKEGTRDVVVEGVSLFRGKGVSIGSLGERAADDQFVSDILFRNVSLDYSLHGARIKTWIGARGLVRNVTFELFKLHNVAYGVLIDQNYCPRSQRPEGCTSGDEDWQTVDAINIEDVRFRNFSGTYMQKDRSVACARCRSVTFRSVRLQRSPDAPEPRSRYDYY